MELVQIYLNINRDLQPDEINKWANSLFEISRDTTTQYFSISSDILNHLKEINPQFELKEIPFELEITVEEGSIESLIVVSFTLIYQTLISYGSIRESIDYLISDAKIIAKTIKNNVIKIKKIKSDEIIRSRITVKSPRKLLKLLKNVESGKILPEQASEEIMFLLNHDLITTDQFGRQRLFKKLLKEFDTSYNSKSSPISKVADFDTVIGEVGKQPIYYEKKEKIKDKETKRIGKNKQKEKKKGIKIKWDSVKKETVIKEYYK